MEEKLVFFWSKLVFCPGHPLIICGVHHPKLPILFPWPLNCFLFLRTNFMKTNYRLKNVGQTWQSWFVKQISCAYHPCLISIHIFCIWSWRGYYLQWRIQGGKDKGHLIHQIFRYTIFFSPTTLHTFNLIVESGRSAASRWSWQISGPAWPAAGCAFWPEWPSTRWDCRTLKNKQIIQEFDRRYSKKMLEDSIC